MKRSHILFLIIICIPTILNAWADWQSISDQHFRIYFKDKWEDEAQIVLKSLEYYRPQLETLTGGSVGQIPITIEDLGNEANGYTDPFTTKIALFAYPPTSNSLAVCENWWQLVAQHEYIHMLQMTREYGFTKILRAGFSNYLYPEIWQPGWMTEGITVYGEAQLSPYTGRLNGGTYRTIISTLAMKDRLPSLTKAAYNSIDTPQANYYVFGGAFFDYLAKTYGNDRFRRVFDETSASTLAYLNGVLPLANLDGAFLTAYGKPLKQLWEDWMLYEKQQPYTPPVRQVTADGWYKSDLQVVDNKLYYIAAKAEKTGPGSKFMSYRLYSVDLPGSVVIDDKMPTQVFPNNMIKPRIVVEQNTEFPAGYKILNGDLYYSRTELKKGYANNEMDGYGGSVELLKQNLRTGISKIMVQGQIRAFLPLSDDSILISEDNQTHTGSVIYQLSSNGNNKTVIFESKALIHCMIAYQDKYIFGIKNNWQNCSIVYFNPKQKTFESIINTPYYTTPISVSGDTLIFNAVFDGKTRAYAYDLNERFCYKLGKCDDVRYPIILPSNRNLFISIDEMGYDIYQDELKPIPFSLPVDDIPSVPFETPDKAELVVKRLPTGRFETYLHNLGHMAVPRLLHLPILAGKGDSLVIGCTLSGSDVIGDFPAWSATAVYDTKVSGFKYTLGLQNNFFRPVKQDFFYSNIDKQTLSATQSITLHRQENYGIQNANLGFSIQTKEAYKRKIWTPFVDIDYAWAKGRIFTRQFVPFETKDFLPSDRERLGWQSIYNYHQKMPFSSEIKAKATIAEDKNAEPDEVFNAIRGYDEAIDTNSGALLQLSWYRPLLIIRDGLWNPQFYVEDVCLGLFGDAATSFPYKENLRQTSCGIEIITEVNLAYYLNLNIGVRYSYNKDYIKLGQFFINTLF